MNKSEDQSTDKVGDVTAEMIAAGHAELGRQGVALDQFSRAIFVAEIYKAMTAAAGISRCASCGEMFNAQNFHLPLGLCHGCATPKEVARATQSAVARIDPMEFGRLKAELSAIERHLNKAGVERVSEKQATSDRVFGLIRNGVPSARTPMTNGEIMEEFLDRDEAVWSLIDEVRAYRQGVGLTHSGRDPIEIITDKYFGISSREHIARTREMIAKAKSRRPTDSGSAKK